MDKVNAMHSLSLLRQITSYSTRLVQGRASDNVGVDHRKVEGCDVEVSVSDCNEHGSIDNRRSAISKHHSPRLDR